MNTSTIEKYTKQIIEDMYKRYEYIIEDFSFLEGKGIPWGLSKKLADGTKTALFFININNSNFNETFENEICSKINCPRENLIKVVLISEKKDYNDSTEVQIKLNNFLSTSDLPNNFIILDLINRSIQITGSSMEPIANQIASIMDSTTKMQSHRKSAVVTYSIISINIFMYILSAVMSKGFMDINTNVLVNLGAKYNSAIVQGQWFRLFTCMFLHGGLIHIAANMYSLYSIGPLVEHLYGKIKYISIYIASGIISSLFSFWFSPYVSIGASGAIFGLLGVLFIFALRERKRVGKSFFINVASAVIINLYIGLSLPGIDNYAHLGGLLSGITFGTVISLYRK